MCGKGVGGVGLLIADVYYNAALYALSAADKNCMGTFVGGYSTVSQIHSAPVFLA